MTYILTLDEETTATGSDHKDQITIEQDRHKVYLTFKDLAEIVNWANRNMDAFVLAPKGKAEKDVNRDDLITSLGEYRDKVMREPGVTNFYFNNKKVRYHDLGLDTYWEITTVTGTHRVYITTDVADILLRED